MSGKRDLARRVRGELLPRPDGAFTLEVGIDRGHVVVNLAKGVQTDAQGRFWLGFSPKEARDFARVLLVNADRADV